MRPPGIVIVTGGASGLGLGTVRLFVQRGYLAGVLDLHGKEHIDKPIAAELGEKAMFCETDASSEGSVEDALNAITKHFAAPIRGAVTCAGICPAAKVVSSRGMHSMDLFNKVLSVNLTGTFNVTRQVADRMKALDPIEGGERGVIITTSSNAAEEGQIGQAAYAASKGAVSSMVLPIARELAAFGIRVNAIAPGPMATPMSAAFPEKVLTSLTEQIPFPQRLGHAEEFASLAWHIFENTYINGAIVRLDAGVRMASK